MSNTVSGIYIEYEYISFVRVDKDSGAIVTTENIPLDTMIPHEKSVAEGLKQLKISLKKGEPVYFSFQSAQTIIFQTEISPLVEDVHEALSWELLSRTDEELDKFSFVTLTLGDDRALGIAQPQEEIKKYLKLLKKVGVRPRGVSLNIIGLMNLMELNYGTGKETVLFHVSAPTSFIIYVRDGMLWDVRMIYGLDEAVTSEELVPSLMNGLAELKNIWNINDELLTKMSGALLSNQKIKRDLVQGLPNCYELNCFEKIPDETGNDENTNSRLNPVVSVAAGLALSGAKQ